MTGAHPSVTRVALVLALLCGCHGEHEHGDAEHGEAEHGHGHGHEGASEAVTRWGASTQLFVEFPALVVGEPSAFAAHLTRLQDHAAIDHGTLVVELNGGGHPVERFSVGEPTVPGIFRPIVTPTYAGRRSLTLRYDSSELSETHGLGELTVFTTRELADAAVGEEEESAGAISYLLEQQWKVEFGIERVELRELRPSVPAFARLTSPPDAASSVTAPHAGRIDAHGDRFPLVGDEVDAGDVLFGLGTVPEDSGDPASLDLAVEQAKIEVQAAQREVDRLAPLVAQGVVATRRLDEANSALASANAQMRSARRRARSLGQSQRVGGHADHLDVPSPISGAVAELLISPGVWVGEGQPLARIVSRDRLWLDVSVPDAYVSQLGAVSGAWFQLVGVDGVIELPATALVSVGIEVDSQTRTLPVRFQVDNGQRELFAGMTTQAHLIVDSPRSSVAVPVAAVVDDAGVDVVYVQSGGESFERRPVELGIRDGGYVEVRDGVASGEWVVARGAYSVKLASSSTAAIGHGHAH
jgi:RND family efflux transporter MFP subunit